LNAEEAEFQGKAFRGPIGLLDVGVDAVHEGLHDGLAARVIMGQLLRQVLAKLEESGADIALEFAGS